MSERMEFLLEQIVIELRTLRADVDAIRDVLPLVRPLYDPDDHFGELQDIKDGIVRASDAVTGGIDQVGGKDLSDVVHAVEMMDLSIQAR